METGSSQVVIPEDSKLLVARSDRELPPIGEGIGRDSYLTHSRDNTSLYGATGQGNEVTGTCDTGAVGVSTIQGNANIVRTGDDSQQQLPVKVVKHKTFCSEAYQEKIIFSAIAHFGLVISLTITLYYKFGVDHDGDLYEDVVVNGWSIIALSTTAAFYLLIWLDLYLSYDFKCLLAMKGGEEFEQYMQNMHSTKPTLTMCVVCYHTWEGLTNVQSRDTYGNRQTRLEYREYKWVQHRAQEDSRYTSVRDVSLPTSSIDLHRCTRITFKKAYRFADAASESAFDHQKFKFKDRNDKDVHQDYSEKLSMPGFTPYMLAYSQPSHRHPLHSPQLYVLLTAVALSWPYRWWLRCTTDRVEYTIVKEIKIDVFKPTIA